MKAKMRHYLTEQEFKDKLMKLDGIITVKCETLDGNVERVHFNATYFFYRIILYTYPFTNDIGLIQEDEQEGWETPLHEVWLDITDQCGWKPFI